MNNTINLTTGYNTQQAQELQWGLERKVDTSKYANPAYTADHMAAIRELLENGYDPSEILDPSLSFEEYTTRAVEIEYAADGVELLEEDKSLLENLRKGMDT